MPDTKEPDCLPAMRALSDESRWRIVKLLTAAESDLTLGEIASSLDLSDYNASRHVKILHEAEILTIRREGRFKYIAIDDRFRQRIDSESGSEVLDLGCCRFNFENETLH